MELAKDFVQRAILELNNDPECRSDAQRNATNQKSPSPLLETLPSNDDPRYPSPLRSKISCGRRELVWHARPRLCHPKWHATEAAVRLRVREAHWQTTTVQDATCRAAKDVQRIPDGGNFNCPDAAQEQ
jgi:hypothetical protein